MIVVQRVLTEWTKRSRGAPGAVRRNAVPEAFPLPPAVVFHQVTAYEKDDFTPASTADDIIPVRSGIRLSHSPDGHLTVTSATDVWCRCVMVFPRRPERVVLDLPPGTWGRWRLNFRLWEEDSDWRYQKWVLNIADLPGPAPTGLFLATPPIQRDDLVQLTTPTRSRQENRIR
ncbi:hypothetical protein GCM10010112_46090 [Actinoplanes lobatus]|uniref:Uncharacterized protein n=1 Tax=Actinoplanes lobatus TaxID=113568 RepID=A0A7W7MH92_9ACTN|nr:hypothetical protein [Actinoplanes lobatus]MBB4750093.1 hypothetical protein [Actinoplanes lobatus]GGN75141.1 hypothetical protein GCM10010112_46090 [Actinoplanes lobatus]GIE39018.1 hypothetical protein Alo02nite_19160 [Actinoplanes lobatus]